MNDIWIDFGPGRYRFFLPMSRVNEVERLTDRSIVETLEDLGAGIGLDRQTEEPRFLGMGGAKLAEIYQIIRCAAVGGGKAQIAGEEITVSALDATKLVDEYVDGRPYTESAPVAWAILNHTIMGPTGPKLKKKVEQADE